MVPPMPDFPEVSLLDTSHRVLRHADGDYGLSVAWPRQPAPPGGYPVMYLLDAQNSFATTVEAIRARCHRADATGVPPTVVAGLALRAGNDRSRRTRDFTPPGLQLPADDELAPSTDTGGATALLAWILDTVLPLVESDHAVDANRRTLFGHSLSGFFVLQALFRQPNAFETFVAASPSIWWDPPGVMADAARLSESTGSAPRVLLTAGEYEQRAAPWQPANSMTATALARRDRRQMVTHVENLGEQLSALNHRGGAVQTTVFSGEDHASVVMLTINQALRFGPGRLPART
jgi:predicted alpha/beta superfamily hydrolase